MTLTRGDFAAFFAAVRPGQHPFAWQERLLDDLLTEQRWPERIAAPTGTGKSAVVDVHVFACALRGWGLAPPVPRRLSVIVDRRFVVDSHDEHARRIAELLTDPDPGVLAEVARGLRHLRPEPDRLPDRAPLLTARLRGGAPPPRDWRDEPESCLVVVATPDMWGSRLLLRGYGSSRRAWPREAGLLAYDSVVVVDEAHLSRQLLATARRVGTLLGCSKESIGVTGLQVVEMTATPEPSTAHSVDITEQDVTGNHELRARLQNPKPVQLLPLSWPPAPRGSEKQKTLGRIADTVAELRATEGPTVGCVLNRVASAVEVTELLRGRGLTVELLVGRLRPADVAALRAQRPGLLDSRGNAGVDVLVATQTVEVGVDLDFTALVTELAPASALAQRAGRVNRLGQRAQGPVTVVMPTEALTDKSAPPYQVDELDESAAWLTSIATDPVGITPWRLRDNPPPAARLRRTALHRVELADSWQLAYTSDDAFAEPDLELWLSDDLEPDLDAGLVVRCGLPDDPTDGIAMLTDTPPQPHEVFPVRLRVLRDLLARLSDTAPPVPVYRWRPGDLQKLGGDDSIRPGDVLILPESTALLTGGIVDSAGTEQAKDVFETGRSPRVGGRPPDATLRLGAGSLLDPLAWAPDPVGAAIEHLLKEAAEIEDWTREAKRRLAGDLAGLAGQLPDDALCRAVSATATLLRTSAPEVSAREVDVIVRRVHQEHDGEFLDRLRLVVVDQRRSVADEDLRQTWSRSDTPVTLDTHQDAVAKRARASASCVGLPDHLVTALELAGRHHDDGKADIRFQTLLGAEPGGAHLAKSGWRGVAKERDATASAQLPPGWRHEQLSAALAWESLAREPERDLAVRLAGTSHGHGRIGFPHTAAHLLDPRRLSTDTSSTAVDLFDRGDWDRLVEATDRRFGVWGCAYLEALLRAADGRVSRAGS